LAARGQIFSWETTSLASSKLVMSLLSDFDWPQAYDNFPPNSNQNSH
jgi:hypothetical protein